MRGKGNAWDWFFTGTRITPAYAGKSLPVQILRAAHRDHPRLCGEKLVTVSCHTSGRGSPPPMRGKGNIFRRRSCDIWITPAYAGKRPLERPLTTATKDHPRLCGEKDQDPFGAVRDAGSPPPMRGKAEREKAEREKDRITPAYAGKSSFLRHIQTLK